MNDIAMNRSRILRARQSCDACKSRKTKCVRTGSGPCQYCASSGGACSTSVRQQRRPYYRVSEEEYQCCIRLLGHFMPNATLDLKTMKAMIAEIEQGTEITEISSTATEPVIETEESEVLKEELGCMVIDARGSYTYVGADSSVRFANAITNSATGSRTRRDNDPSIMIPLVRSRLPPEPPESIHSRSSDKTQSPISPSDHHDKPPIYLPHRDVCQRYATRFFSEIQSIYWFYSPEQFYTLVDKTYSDHGASASASWLCSLYSIFAICAAKPDSSPIESLSASATKSAPEYLALAKSLGVAVCDEATTDAVRALALMSLALHSSCFTVTAYLITGMTVRMAYTLGLHRNVSPTHMDSVSRARVHRLWWTIYLLDQEVAIQLGYPFAIVDHIAGIQTPSASEHEAILDPGPGTPHGYQSCVVSLIKLKKKISHTLYIAPAVSPRRVVPFSAVTSCLGDLQEWFEKLPPHLNWTTGTAPGHRRAVAVLHLRYWTTLIHIQRPFLLDTATRPSSRVLPPVKAARYAELSQGCLQSAHKAVAIVSRMKTHDLLSSLVLFDVQCIQELVHVFLLGKGCYAGTRRGDAAGEALGVCMAILRGMERVGWRERVLPELEAQVAARRGLHGSARASRVQSRDRGEEGRGVESEDKGKSNFDVFDMLDLDMGTFTMDGMYHF
ncbi:fungal-specific transcription factor domain-containing protein [Cercophora newfieldiana]|uniref:Fungal-specific transcription factor domain-containing protein n=1 Tax=Cercophora newfieldiana TaxID=92897 RepID=A0AA39Y8N6_9PEZI|nr:fungal-specific transcription factor domain-containing protein [Cercophora newfieldiana]